ncbi:Protein tyrosine kinase Protein kinase domain [Trypanosoma vivax]|uniref:non-specific serine/threonine protein kinase n=1 Tax=Trypanosoma vivax (strain Y486) TaxID=1055687 RepID=G0TRN3_TRYVY|nr:putative protein kinase [Trypanosoma vivax]KAH8608211.1 Protein tyrosine kinase Protein kinase domain [Trypanosoma vivax]CCC46603.1 putative protein kinase [Trypanosoma vivax Y486]
MAECLEIPGEKKVWHLRRHRILGKGSFGCATLYEDADNPDSFVVVKDVNTQIMKKDEEMKALEMEVKILRNSCGHPNIVQFLDHYHDGDFMVYIIMEFCPKGDLGQLIETHKFKKTYESESVVASFMIQALVALNFLHVDQRTLHRDIKPQNIFLHSDNCIRIGDFGVSTILGHVGDTAKVACGSPFYMAPELCEERAYDGKADIWSLGVTLYELMTHNRPFSSTTAAVLMRAIVSGEFQPIPEGGAYSKQLIELVHSFLQKPVITRPTLRRALRSTYVQNHLSCVPISCLRSKHYKDIFGEEVIQKAIKAQEASRENAAWALGSGKNSLNSGGMAKTSSSGSFKGGSTELTMDEWLNEGMDSMDSLIGQKLLKPAHGNAGNKQTGTLPHKSSMSNKSPSSSSNFLSGVGLRSGTGPAAAPKSFELNKTGNDAGDDDYEDDFESDGEE